MRSRGKARDGSGFRTTTILLRPCTMHTDVIRVLLVIQIINGNNLPKSFKWKNTSSAKDFGTALNTPHIKAKIDYFMSNRFPETKKE